ncbi:ABC transporter substrate-binding protein [Komagataeibacter medellinensis]|uniref:ABC transporter ferrichrome transporter substrate-binding periplasmic protein n=1 Tax=Komagataeibacter medellinensis (strain NBRC 3288 / BCRC 11682 / LMG 1693 / Kondo 51) TaxID=634177 RepID=G2I1S9_KOMMN|nr:ABC transporter substrate-binding protein [Komagataeibacter medellinensis]BAK84865.1 ABC transporter ferrichrome transporter substrate-binding periplasmic protein [Komagataeibacter medellinensis NBRC 3288]
MVNRGMGHAGIRALACLMVAGMVAHRPAMARDVTDMAGTIQSVPDQPARIADLWFAHNELVLMLGGAGQIAMTVDRPQARPWMYTVFPVLFQARVVNGPQVTAEALLRDRVDLVFVPDATATITAFRGVGVPTLMASFHDVAGLLRVVDMTATALGTSQAHDTATRYRQMMTQSVNDVRDRLTHVPAGARPRVLHVQSLHPLRVDGADSIVDEWISLAGGRNAATGVSGNMKPVSIEQVAAWDPDVIILGPDSGTPDAGVQAAWQNLRAVREGHVHQNPSGAFTWDRYGSELPLQIRWAAKTLHPELFADLDPVAMTRDFYHTWFHYELSAEQAQLILAARPPQPLPHPPAGLHP